MSMWRVKITEHYGQKPNPNYKTHIDKQAHNLECMKTRLQCLKMQCMSIWKQINKAQPKNFSKNTKTLKISQKFEKPRFKCMENEEKKGLRPLTNEYDLGIGRKWDRKKDFLEGKGFGLRERRELSKSLSERQTKLTLKYI